MNMNMHAIKLFERYIVSEIFIFYADLPPLSLMHHAAHIHSHQRAQYNDDRQIWDPIWPLFQISRNTKGTNRILDTIKSYFKSQNRSFIS